MTVKDEAGGRSRRPRGTPGRPVRNGRRSGGPSLTRTQGPRRSHLLLLGEVTPSVCAGLAPVF